MCVKSSIYHGCRKRGAAVNQRRCKSAVTNLAQTIDEKFNSSLLMPLSSSLATRCYWMENALCSRRPYADNPSAPRGRGTRRSTARPRALRTASSENGVMEGTQHSSYASAKAAVRNQKHIHQPEGFLKPRGCVSTPYRHSLA